MQIAGTTAIVTGAASGLGRATAELLASAGAKVAGFDIAVADAGMDDDGILRHPCDVTSESSVQAALAASESALGPARILVNCAGIMESRRMLGRDGVMPLDHFRRLIDVHLIGTFNMIRLVRRQGPASRSPIRGRRPGHDRQHVLDIWTGRTNRRGFLFRGEGGHRWHDFAIGAGAGARRDPRRRHRPWNLRNSDGDEPARDRA